MLYSKLELAIKTLSECADLEKDQANEKIIRLIISILGELWRGQKPLETTEDNIFGKV